MGAFLKRKAKTTAGFIYQLPADVQIDIKIKTRANFQVATARKLFTNPNAITLEILHSVAKNLKSIWLRENIKESERASVKGFNRSINGGLWDGKGTSVQTSRIAKVAHKVSPSLPIDKAGVIAILGDIGTAIFDCDPNSPKEDVIAFCKIAKHMANKTSMKYEELLEWGQRAKKERGGSAIAPAKKAGEDGSEAERSMLKVGEKPKLTKRSGLLFKDGDVVDTSGFSANWPWQLLPQEYFQCKEPWAGHYSGSIVEVLFTLDLLTKANSSLGNDLPMKSYDETSMLDNVNRRCKAALAGAFLISVGYHSAIEIKPTIWAYLGRGAIGKVPEIFSLRGKPESQKKCDTNATRDITHLMVGCTIYEK